MHDTSSLTLGRFDRLFTEVIAPAVVRDRRSLAVSVWRVPGEPVSFAQATAASFEPVPIGSAWGAPWSTEWFHVTGEVPGYWPMLGTRLELDVDLGWIAQQPGFQAEGAAWTPDGVLIKGISPRNSWVPLPQEGGVAVDLYLEAAANPDVPGNQWTRPTVMGDRASAGTDPLYRLRAVDLVLVDRDVEELLADAKTVRGLVGVLPATSPRRAELIVALEAMCDALDVEHPGRSAAACRAALSPALGRPAASSAHTVVAVGHAHIDSAWLWPVRETRRKVARTVANVLALMDTDPDVTFAFSSAQQFAWVQEGYPDLFERLAARVREGRIVPVGGMWVESDTNMVGSEALVRQFVEGKGYFARELGVEPTSVWLPDSFGYTGSFPQIARLAGCPDFLTQKLSWNDTNRIPHHTFWWEGIDGTRVFTHFPPVDTYNCDLSALELERASAQFAEKGHTNVSLAPFGYGDGGGGPTREMVAQARRTADLDGSPRVDLATPDAFFDRARAEYAAAAPTWVGELYLEYHRGTYTSQARTKHGNRRCEHLLHEAELWATTATVRLGSPYPAQALQRCWRQVLLQQFHDILPGSSIAWVHREAEQHYREVAAELEGIIEEALAALAAPEAPQTAEETNGHPAVAPALLANAAPVPLRGLAPMSVGPAPRPQPATRERAGDGWLLRNDALAIRVDSRGLLTSAVTASGREVVPPGRVGNLPVLFRDIPNTWEAWDIDAHYRRNATELVEVEVVEETETDDGDAALRIVRAFSGSRLEQVLWLDGGDSPVLQLRTDVDWHERQKLLKLVFPLDVLAREARSEMQFGHVARPTHANTSWDAARFETVAHRWVHAGEPGFGVAVANDRTYGHDITRILRDGTVGTAVGLTLLRAPLFPDPDADQGEHSFRHAVAFGADLAEAVSLGYQLNLPPRRVAGGGVAALVRVDHPGVLVETVKLAGDGSGDVVIRLYESLGGRASARLVVDFPHSGVTETDLLERPVPGGLLAESAGGYEVSMRPFQVRTLRVAR